MLTGNAIKLINRLIELTNSDKIIWDKYNTPNSFIYKSKIANYISNRWKTLSGDIIKDCVEFAIQEDGTVSSANDFVFCVNSEDISIKDDYTLIDRLYKAIESKYIQKSDREFENLINALPA